MLMEEMNTTIAPTEGEYWGGLAIGVGVGLLAGTAVVVGIALIC
jgi:hypothetical protein